MKRITKLLPSKKWIKRAGFLTALTAIFVKDKINFDYMFYECKRRLYEKSSATWSCQQYGWDINNENIDKTIRLLFLPMILGLLIWSFYDVYKKNNKDITKIRVSWLKKISFLAVLFLIVNNRPFYDYINIYNYYNYNWENIFSLLLPVTVGIFIWSFWDEYQSKKKD